MSLPEYIDEIKAFLVSKGIPKGIPDSVDAAVILGSGLGGFVDHIDEAIDIPYQEIPHFPQTTVAGHSGSLLCGMVKGKRIIAFAGRFHHYEGHTFEKAILPVQVASAFNTNLLVVSNAAGGINPKFRVGDLMVIDDVMRQNLMLTPHSSSKWRYNHYKYVEKVRNVATQLGITTQRGTYMYVTGPNYETPAEIRSFRLMGADAVGMSTAPELFEAARLNIPSVAISLISNAAAGMTSNKLNHEEVKEAGDLVKEDFARLVSTLIARW